MRLADRLDNLGTETAFAVSAAAEAWRAKGNTIYPFHLGDIDLPTPANIVDAMNQAIANGKTGYCPGPGVMPLREALAADIGDRRGLSLEPRQIVVQPGGKPVIGKWVQTVMNPGDEILYPNPGYPIYESQIEYHGGVAVPYGYLPTDCGFDIDLDQLSSLISPATRGIVYNDLQNPISAESTAQEREAIAQLACEHDLQVLSDEAYFEMRYSGTSASIASLPGMAERTTILYTFSKKFAMTGWRLGCAAAPAPIADVISKLNTNDESCTTHFVQYGGLAGLQDDFGAAPIRATLQERRDAAHAGITAIDGFSVAKPNATFYLFPDVTEAMERKGFAELGEFATAALQNTGVSFCTRAHFGRAQPGETRKYVRFAYSGIGTDDITEGLGKLKAWIEE